MKLLISLLTLFLITHAIADAQNKYIPPDPYSIETNKQYFSKYLIVSPNYFGPNALPVPRMTNGLITDKFWAGVEYEQYKSEGDLTRDLYLDLRFPIAKGKAVFAFNYVPYEFYQVDSATSRARRSQSGGELRGTAHGDVYFGAKVQLLKDKKRLPDLAFGMFCRTASGTEVEDVRYTDTPGYFLDLSVGKSHHFKKRPDDYLRWYGMIGFYVWQTYLDEYPQNDALSFGGGVELHLGRIGFLNSIRGYSGYMNNGDQPLVYRSEIQLSEGMASLILGYEYGIRDYPFSCFRAGVRLVGLNDEK